MKKYNVVDLFCGMGGSAVGIHRHPEFKTLLAVDFWDKACTQYKLNFKEVNVKCIDIHNLDEKEVLELCNNEPIDVLIGGPPCQGFSMVTRNKFNGNNIEMNNKNHLFLEFLRIASILKPKIIIPMHFSDDYSRMKEFIEKFKHNEDVKVIEIKNSMEKVLE